MSGSGWTRADGRPRSGRRIRCCRRRGRRARFVRLVPRSSSSGAIWRPCRCSRPSRRPRWSSSWASGCSTSTPGQMMQVAALTFVRLGARVRPAGVLHGAHAYRRTARHARARTARHAPVATRGRYPAGAGATRHRAGAGSCPGRQERPDAPGGAHRRPAVGLEEQSRVEQFMGSVSAALRVAEPVEQFCAQAAALVREVWPAEHVLLLVANDQESRVGHPVRTNAMGRRSRSTTLGDDAPRYRKASLPAPVKDALRRGFYADAGLPFSRDPAFPQARSFVAMSLEHRGAPAGVLLAMSSSLTPPSTEPLRRSPTPVQHGLLAFHVPARDGGGRHPRRADRRVHARPLPLDAAARGRPQQSVRALRHLHADRCRRSAPHERGVRLQRRATRSSPRWPSWFGDSSARRTRWRAWEGASWPCCCPRPPPTPRSIVAERVRAKVEEHPFILQRNQSSG